MADSLYERLGGTEGITKIASDVVDNHVRNPKVGPRFAGSDILALKQKAADFFITGSGGPQVYAGKDMLEAHRHMNISDEEFMAVVDDTMDALAKAGMTDETKAEVLYIFYCLRPQIVGV